MITENKEDTFSGDFLRSLGIEGLPDQALQLCYQIEKLPASEQQTKVSLMASNLRSKLYQIQQAICPSSTQPR